MSDTSPPRLTRRAILAAGLALPATQAFAANGQVVTILGDSITAGFGLPAKDALPAQLHQALLKMGVANVVRGAGVSGDTTLGGAARVDFSVQPDTEVCIVALGGNDLLRGLDTTATRTNLDRILRRLKQRRMGVILAGLKAPPEIGGGYVRDFNAIFPSLAKTYGVALYPDLLAGVARNRLLNQGDGIHPNAQGVQIIVKGLAPVVARALKARA
ncbi:MAG: arylesterase [Caulobacteraceae bacterium]|nr:arylesterase [Caulobacteraceae bacterium]